MGDIKKNQHIKRAVAVFLCISCLHLPFYIYIESIISPSLISNIINFLIEGVIWMWMSF